MKSLIQLQIVLCALGFFGCSAASQSSPKVSDSPSSPNSDARSADDVALDPAPDTAPPDVPESTSGGVVFTGGFLAATSMAADVRVVDGRIHSVGADLARPGDEEIDISGRFITPSFIDSHVHFSYRPGAEAMADGGIAAAVDHASPVSAFDEPPGPVQLLRAGPMITAHNGYPTQSWGSGGYGLECPSAACASAAVAELYGLGAGLIKIPFDGGPALTDEQVSAAIVAAHERGLRVSAHALLPADAIRAAGLGADLLAHTPVAALPDDEFVRWSGKAVISSLGAFGGSAEAVANLTSLRAAGAVVLYGTDYGNTSRTGIDPVELGLLAAAGLDGAAIIVAGTSAPAEFWGFDDLGQIAPGKAASFVVTCDDPRLDAMSLTRPAGVWLNGERRANAGCLN